MAMARDVGSPSKNDPHFPTVRQKDWYIGSSWATGIGGGTRQQEASAEVNSNLCHDINNVVTLLPGVLI